MDTLLHESVENVEFSSDGTQLISVGKQIKVWSLPDGMLITTPMSADREIGLKFDAARNRALTSCGGRHRLWDCHTWNPVGPEFDAGKSNSTLSLSADGTKVAISSSHGLVQTWSTRRGQLLIPHMAHSRNPEEVAFANDGQTLMTHAGDTISIWDGASLGVRICAPIQSSAKQVRFSSSSRFLLLVSERHLQLWEPWSRLAPVGKRVLCSADEPAGQVLKAAAGEFVIAPANFGKHDHLATIVDMQGAKHIVMSPEAEKSGVINRIETSPDGNWFVRVPVLLGTTLWLGSISEPERTPVQINLEGTSGKSSAFAATFSSDSKLLAVGGFGEIQILNPATGDKIAPLISSKLSPSFLRFSPDGKILYAANAKVTIFDDATPIRVACYDVATGKPLSEWQLPEGNLEWLQLNALGDRMMTVVGSSAFVWDTTNHTLLLPPLRHTGVCRTANWSDDQSLLITCGNSQFGRLEVRLWDARNGSPVGLAFPLSGVSLSDSKYVNGTFIANLNRELQLRVQFLRDGRTPQLEEWTWQLCADERSSEILSQLCLVQAGYKVTETGATLPIDTTAEWKRFVQATNFRAELPNNAQKLAFHLQAADEAESLGNSFTAGHHVDRILELVSNEYELLLRRARLYMQSKDIPLAIKFFESAAEHFSERADLLADRGRALATHDEWDRAITDFQRASDLYSKEKAFDSEANATRLRIELGYALAAAGRDTEYRTVARELVTQFRASRSPEQIRAVVKLCSLMPDAAADNGSFLKFANNGVEKIGADIDQYTILAMAQLRGGDTEAAQQTLLEGNHNDESSTVRGAIAKAFLDLQTFGKRDEATKVITALNAWARRKLGNSDFDWKEELEYRLLIRELTKATVEDVNQQK